MPVSFRRLDWQPVSRPCSGTIRTSASFHTIRCLLWAIEDSLHPAVRWDRQELGQRRDNVQRAQSRSDCHGASEAHGGLRTPSILRKTIEQGAATSVLLRVRRSSKRHFGRYFDDCQEASVVDERGSGPFKGVARYAVDEDNAFRLWEIATRMLGLPL